MWGLTWHAQTRVFVDESGTDSGGGVLASQSALLLGPQLSSRWGSHSMSSCDGVRPIVFEPVQFFPKGSPIFHTKAPANPSDTGHQPENWQRVSMFFGSLHQKLRVGGSPTGSVHRDGSFLLCIVTGASVCCERCTSSLATLRRHFLRAVAATVFFVLVAAVTLASCRGTSQQNIALQKFLQPQTLRRHVSRLVAAGVYPSVKDVAASQYVCSRGADNLSSFVSFFGSDLSSTCFGWCYGRCRLH